MFQGAMLFKLGSIWWSLFAVFLFIIISRLLFKKRLNLPPGPISLPVVGYLPFLGLQPFLTLHKLGKRYGNIFSLRLGTTLVVVLNDIETIRKGLHNSSTLSRPPKFLSFIPGGMGFSSANGAYWTEQRLFTFKMMTVLGFSASKWERLMQDEMEDLIKTLSELKGLAVNVVPMFVSSATNNIWSFIFGKRLHAGHPARVIIDRCVHVIPQFFRQTGIIVFYPTLSSVLGRLNLLSYGKPYEEMVQYNEIIKAEVLKCKAEIDRSEGTYVDEYLKEIEKQGGNTVKNYFSVETLTGNIKSLFLGGGDTTKTSIHWLCLAMAAFPEKQTKVHRELDEVLGSDGIPSWNMRTKLLYTNAVVMEGQRWRTIAPLSLLRVASENTTICDFDVPKGSIVIANLWSAHNDEKYWQNPHEFIPERFLEENGTNLISKPASYAPFSVGKWKCPGDLIGLMATFTMFTSIMTKFDIFPSSEEKPISLEGCTGSVYSPIETELRFIPRH